MKKGYIQLNRKMFDHELWNEKRVFSRAEAWIDLIQSVNYTNETKLIKGKVFNLKSGEFLASNRFLQNRWGWGHSRVTSFLIFLQDSGMITTRAEHSQTVISLVKWGVYNGGGTQSGTVSVQQTERPAEQRKTSKTPMNKCVSTKEVSQTEHQTEHQTEQKEYIYRNIYNNTLIRVATLKNLSEYLQAGVGYAPVCFLIAKSFHNQVLAHRGNLKSLTEAKAIDWVRIIHEMLTIDGVTIEQLIAVKIYFDDCIEKVKGTDPFWIDRLYSLSVFRKKNPEGVYHFDMITAKVRKWLQQGNENRVYEAKEKIIKLLEEHECNTESI